MTADTRAAFRRENIIAGPFGKPKKNSRGEPREVEDSVLHGVSEVRFRAYSWIVMPTPTLR